MFKLSSNRYFNITINLFFIVNAILLLRIVNIDGFHIDELTIGWFTDGTFVDIFRRSIIRGDSYPPFGHILIWLWKKIPCTLNSTFCLKIPQVFMGLFTYFLFSKLYKKKFENNIIFGLFTILYFGSYSTMFFVTDLKPHGIIQFLIVAYFYFEEKDSNFKYLFLIFASIMHYVSIFLIIAIIVKEIFIGYKEFDVPIFSVKTFKKLIVFGIGPIISFSYYLFSSSLGGSQLQKDGANPLLSFGKSILFIFGRDLFYLLLIIFSLLAFYFLILYKSNLLLAIKDIFKNADVSSILGIYVGFVLIIEFVSLAIKPISASRNLVIFSPFIFYIVSCVLYELIYKIKKNTKSVNYLASIVALFILIIWALNMQYMLKSPSRNEENFSIPDIYLDLPIIVETSDLATKVSIQLRYDIKNYDYSNKIYYFENYFLEKDYPDWVKFEYSFAKYNIEKYTNLNQDLFVHYPHEFSPAYNFYETLAFLQNQNYKCKELIFEELLKQKNAICEK